MLFKTQKRQGGDTKKEITCSYEEFHERSETWNWEINGGSEETWSKTREWGESYEEEINWKRNRIRESKSKIGISWEYTKENER